MFQKLNLSPAPGPHLVSYVRRGAAGLRVLREVQGVDRAPRQQRRLRPELLVERRQAVLHLRKPWENQRKTSGKPSFFHRKIGKSLGL